MKNYINYIGIVALGIVACEPEFENPINEEQTYSSGEADFSNYVALGNSLTAGYADNALYITGQEYSYPNILSQQFAKVDGGEFVQPLMADDAGGLLFNGEQFQNYTNRRVLAFDAQGNPSPQVYTGRQPTTEITNTLAGPFNNMGVPGAKSFHLGFQGYGNLAGVEAGLANPYFARFASSPSANIIGDAVSQNPTFFSLWIGNNDVLSYATSGGTGVDQVGVMDPTTYGPNDITDPTVFAGTYSRLVDALVLNGAEGILINIPDVTDIPFFTYIPYAPLSPVNPDFGPMIPTLNETFMQLNAAFQFLGVPERSVEFSETGASALVIRDESLTDISQQLTQVLMTEMDAATAALYGSQYGQARQANEGDLIPLTSSGALGTVNQQRLQQLTNAGLPQETAGKLAINGVTYPLEDRYVLTATEQELIATATRAYNEAIQREAQENDLAFVDANSLLSTLSTAGIVVEDSRGRTAAHLTSQYVTGGAFSLDGVHLTPRGNALIANKIIEQINEVYSANLPKVNVGYYPAVTINNDVD